MPTRWPWRFWVTPYANPLMLGFAWQKGWVPVSRAALLKAIELNGVAVDKNRLAFECGRVAAHDLSGLNALLFPADKSRPSQVLELRESLEALLKRRASQLTAYQNRAYADLYLQAVAKIRVVEEKRVRDGLQLTEAVARNLAKLMAYKDEYEVARLHASPVFLARLVEQFEGEPGKDYQLGFHLAPPLLARKDADGHLVKRRYGQWLVKLFPCLLV
jgi:indolepyruvate ferredoxin oxidoreductase